MLYKPMPSLAVINWYLDYEPTTGLFRWARHETRPSYIGRIAGAKQKYIRIKLLDEFWNAHRLAWFIMTKQDPKHLMIDHKDRDKYNNSFSNLRLATNSENQFNRQKQPGISILMRGTFKASLCVRGSKFHLGYFLEYWDALCARKSAEVKYGYRT